MLIRSSMKVVKVSSIQFASFLVPILLNVLADAYFLSDDSSYYDDESLSEEMNEVETQDTQGTRGIQGTQVAQGTQSIRGNYKNSGYSYGYKVNNPQTGDFKTQHEEKIGDVVRGSYSLIDPDGTRRIVEYTADPQQGFNAIVKKEPLPDNFQNQLPLGAFTPLPAIMPTPLVYAHPVAITPEPVAVKYPKKLFAYVPQSYAFYPQKPKPKAFNDYIKNLPFFRYFL